MEFTKIRLSGLTNVDLPIVGALPTDAYILKAADGLGPPEIDVSIARTPEMGAVYQGRQSQGREIVLRVGLNPDYSTDQTPSDLRVTLYGMLTSGPSDEFKIQLYNGSTFVVETQGYVKRFETVPFAKDPEVQITFACINPYLEGTEVTLSLPNDEDDLSLTYEGTAPAGVNISVWFDTLVGGVDGFWVENDAGQRAEILTHSFLTGDRVQFDSRVGQRNVWRTRSGTTSTLLQFLDSASVWFQLHPGVNTFHVDSDDSTWNAGLVLSPSLTYKPQYWGI